MIHATELLLFPLYRDVENLPHSSHGWWPGWLDHSGMGLWVPMRQVSSRFIGVTGARVPGWEVVAERTGLLRKLHTYPWGSSQGP